MSSADSHPALPAHGKPNFATTHWSLVLAAGGTNSIEIRPAMSRLLELYWYPLYAFVRSKGRKQEEAFDLTQEFLSRLLERNLLENLDPAKGRFRTFLLTCLERFLIDQWARDHRLKRGGGLRIVSLSAPEAEQKFQLEPVDSVTPERIFERRWAMTLLEQSMKCLKDECVASGKGMLFEAAKPLMSGEGNQCPYAELASRLGMNEGALKTAVHRLRKRYGALLREQIAQTVSGPEEVEEELRDLFQKLE